MYRVTILARLIVPETAKLSENVHLDIKYVAFLSTTFVTNILYSDKYEYLASSVAPQIRAQCKVCPIVLSDF
jgi:hypothetical protein